MHPESSSRLQTLRAQAEQQGVSPTDEDLEATLTFLEVLLPPLRELEERIPPETPIV
jgi:hypothetical protein